MKDYGYTLHTFRRLVFSAFDTWETEVLIWKEAKQTSNHISKVECKLNGLILLSNTFSEKYATVFILKWFFTLLKLQKKEDIINIFKH